MKTVLDYVKEYGDKVYAIEKFNDIDNLVYSTLSYINFKDIVSTDRNTIKLQDAAELFLRTYSYKEYGKLGLVFRHAYKLLELIKDKPRYKNNLLYNYEYKTDNESQFSAVCIRLYPTLVFVSFEGTDEKMNGWKEDAELSYKFPVKCQEYAINYINKSISLFDMNVIIGGHSKGGNLAMVAGMYAKDSIFRKIKKIYNNDGPGFIRKQYDSVEYQKMSKKTVTIIPNYSIVGLLLNHQEDYIVVESTRRDILAHSPVTWKVDGVEFKTAKLSRMSKKIDTSMRTWLLNHTYEEREKMFSTLFKTFKKSGIIYTTDFKDLKKIINLIKGIKNLDEETKDLLVSFVKANVSYYIKSGDQN